METSIARHLYKWGGGGGVWYIVSECLAMVEVDRTWACPVNSEQQT